MKGVGIVRNNTQDNRLYTIWRTMHARCKCPTRKGYEYYGGRGITVCEEWNSFVSFCVWAVLNGYASNLSIDRIDPDKNYCPENCRWATPLEQGSNKAHGNKVTIQVEINGQKRTVIKSYRIQKRKTYEYAIELLPVNGHRRQVSKSGFLEIEDAKRAAEERIKSLPTSEYCGQ